MWTKIIIVDDSVKIVNRSRFSYAFGGYDADQKEIWTKKADAVKLYDSEHEAVEDAKKFGAVLPVKIFQFNIDLTNPKMPAVTLVEIKIPLAVIEEKILNVKV